MYLIEIFRVTIIDIRTQEIVLTEEVEEEIAITKIMRIINTEATHRK